uniref:Uncharacterized protein LOC114337409 n=1 Tax=Diabrotica virgifera virgifera TaxID=50390 RepID=A0A6P7G9V0_DIAVI
MVTIHLNDAQKARAIAKLEGGWSLRQVSTDLNVSHICIWKIKQRWDNFHSIARLSGSRGQKISRDQQDEMLLDYLRESHFTTTKKAREETAFPSSICTARRSIKASGLFNSAAARKPFLTEDHKRRRVEFCNEFINRDANFWSNVAFSDEKVFYS